LPGSENNNQVIQCDIQGETLKLTTVQQRGQNHHISSRANSRNTTSNDISTMVPSNCTHPQNERIQIKVKTKNCCLKKGLNQERKYSQPPLMTNNRGAREEDKRNRRKNEESWRKVYLKKAACQREKIPMYGCSSADCTKAVLTHSVVVM